MGWSKNDMKIFNEEFLEPFARYFRFKEGVKYLPNKKEIVLADIGCGPMIRFFNFAFKKGIKFKKYIGIDPLINNNMVRKYYRNKEIYMIKNSLKNKIPLLSNSIDVITGFAFLEHMDNPDLIVKESYRCLKKGGLAIFTMPTPKAKKFLEFLSFKLGVISEREIREHKNYFTKEMIFKLQSNIDTKVKFNHKYFELGWNNLFVMYKL